MSIQNYYLPDFIELQRKSFFRLLSAGFIEELSKRNPITNYRKDLEIYFYPQYYKLSPRLNPQKAIIYSKTYSAKIYVPIQLLDRKRRQISFSWALLGDIPLMTKRGHFVVNGASRVIINQIIRGPGIYYHQKEIKSPNSFFTPKRYYADFISMRGTWLRLSVDKKNLMWAEMKKTPKIPLLWLLLAVGWNERVLFNSLKYPSRLLNTFYNGYELSETEHENYFYINSTSFAQVLIYSKVKFNKIETYNVSQKKLAQGDKLVKKLEINSKKWLFQKFMNPRTYDLSIHGRLCLNRKLGLSLPKTQRTLTPLDLLYATDHLITLNHNKDKGLAEIDDIDHLKNRRIRTSSDLIQLQLGIGLIRLEKKIREQINSLKPPSRINEIINTKPLNGALREFFGTSPLCLTPDHNVLTTEGWLPINEVTLKHKVAVLNPDGTFHYAYPNFIHKYNYNGLMYSVQTSSINFFCTLNHRMYVNLKANNSFSRPFSKCFSDSRKNRNSSFFRDTLFYKGFDLINNGGKNNQINISNGQATQSFDLNFILGAQKSHYSVYQPFGFLNFLRFTSINLDKTCFNSKPSFSPKHLDIFTGTLLGQNDYLCPPRSSNFKRQKPLPSSRFTSLPDEGRGFKQNKTFCTGNKLTNYLQNNNRKKQNKKVFNLFNYSSLFLLSQKNSSVSFFRSKKLNQQRIQKNLDFSDLKVGFKLIPAREIVHKESEYKKTGFLKLQNEVLKTSLSHQFILPSVIKNNKKIYRKILPIKPWLNIFAFWIRKGWTSCLKKAFWKPLRSLTQRPFLRRAFASTNEEVTSLPLRSLGQEPRVNSGFTSLPLRSEQLEGGSLPSFFKNERGQRRKKIKRILYGVVLKYSSIILNKNRSFYYNRKKKSIMHFLAVNMNKLGFFYLFKKNIVLIPNKQLYAYLKTQTKSAVDFQTNLKNLNSNSRIKSIVKVSNQKRFPNWVWRLPKNQARILLNNLLINNRFGYKIKQKNTFFKTLVNSFQNRFFCFDRTLTKDFSRLALHAGLSMDCIGNKIIRSFLFSEKLQKQSSNFLKSFIIMRLNISKKLNNPLVNSSNNIQDGLVYYTGPVFCLSVPSQIFYVERQGKVAWTGNSQFMDQINPLAEITHKRRLTSLGPNGISRDTATMAIRGIHPTHYGRICPVETPEGKNAGLVNSGTNYARLNNFVTNLIMTPFYKVYKGIILNKKVYYLSAEQEQEVVVTPADIALSVLNFLPSTSIPARKSDEFTFFFRNQINYQVFSPISLVSVATSLVPFLEHDDANRALMGANMQRQAVPLIRPDSPIVGTGQEAKTVSDSGHLIQAKKSGIVCYLSAKKILVYNL